MTADQVVLTGICGRGHHGVYEFERDQGQDFVVDITCTVDLGAAAASDDLADTIDYSALATAVVADIERDPVNLIERLADRIARTCLHHRRITTATVTVHKPQAPMPVRVGDVAVTLTRSNAT
ncbi:MAG: dihydroneopterin aldolase [Microlunatus sp.]|nr:dihydroneopterin aldolase [Microlunatus sp.]MDN5770605.1 dihydroneopterin aldolase [Microlunatus sp.]MDN5803402.1 dihydroneopterin aldolase [Microlunatus sp.]